VFYRRLMSVVDDFGRFDGRATVLRCRLYPLKIDTIREADITRWLAECEKAGLIALYEVDSKPYILFHKLGPARAKESKFPAPPKAAVSVCLQTQTDESRRLQTRADVPYSVSGSDSGSNPPTPSGGGVVADDDAPEEVVDAAGTMIRPEPFSEVVAAWVAAKLPGWNSPGGIQANGARRGLFVARQRNPRWRGLWREAVARLGRSKRASGGSKGFEQGVRLDTFLKDEAFLDRIIEGEWDDEGVSPPPPPPIGRSKMLDQGMMDPMPLRTGSPHASAYRGGSSHGF
jgi:hypothetical protein